VFAIKKAVGTIQRKLDPKQWRVYRKGILRYYGSGIWKGDPKSMRRNRV